MSENSVFPVPEELAKSAWCDESAYFKLYAQSIDDPEGFWGEHGKRIHWFKPYTKVKDVSFGPGDVHIKWYHDGTTNVSYNCLDRHLPVKKDDTAIIWEGDDPEVSATSPTARSTRRSAAWPTP
jgi:acetyl-CoA synthetase